MTPVVCVVGRSGSGKTRLICRLVEILRRRGYRIACVKHHPHGDPDLDRRGKDSWKFSRSGANSVIVAGRNRTFISRPSPHGGRRPENRLRRVLEFLPPADLVLAEGFHGEAFPKIAVIRSGRRSRAPSRLGKNLIAAVTDHVRVCPLDGHVRCFPASDPDGLASYLERMFLKPIAWPKSVRPPARTLRRLRVCRGCPPRR